MNQIFIKFNFYGAIYGYLNPTINRHILILNLLVIRKYKIYSSTKSLHVFCHFASHLANGWLANKRAILGRQIWDHIFTQYQNIFWLIQKLLICSSSKYFKYVIYKAFSVSSKKNEKIIAKAALANLKKNILSWMFCPGFLSLTFGYSFFCLRIFWLILYNY